MTQLAIGLRVQDIRGRGLGSVSQVLLCCFEVDRRKHIQQSAIFNVTEAGIELCCDGDQLDRYACRIHGASAAK